MATIETTGTDLVSIPKADALTYFTTEGKFDPVLARIRSEIDAFKPDLRTASSRKAIASMAYKVAQSKSYLDGIGKELVDAQKEIPKKIDATRKTIRDTLDKWRDEVRQPLTDWEVAEDYRVTTIKGNLSELVAIASDQTERPAEAIRERLAEVKAEDVSETAYAEFAGLAAEAKLKAIAALEDRLAKAEKREAEAAELARLRADAEARAKADAEAKAQEAAAERERKAAEAAAAAERAKADAAAKAAQEAAERREREHKEALEAVERKAAAAAAKAKADAEAAVLKEAAEKARREADREHRGTINRAALAALVDGGISEDVAKQVVTLIAAGNIPAVTINY